MLRRKALETVIGLLTGADKTLFTMKNGEDGYGAHNGPMRTGSRQAPELCGSAGKHWRGCALS